MKQTMLNTAEDLQWLKDTHFPNLPETAKCVILMGNEDSPEQFHVYTDENPLMNDEYMTYNVFNVDEESKVVEQSLYDALKEANVEMSSWQSDLCFKLTEDSKTIMNRFKKIHPEITFKGFINNNDKKPWIEAPFQFDPFWDKTKK